MKKQKKQRAPKPAKKKQRKPQPKPLPKLTRPIRGVDVGLDGEPAPMREEPLSAVIARAGDALAAGDGETALAIAKQALVRDPQDPDALTLTGAALARRGDPVEAKNILETALAFVPDHVPALLELGLIQERMGTFKDAETQFRAVLAAAPGHPEARFRLGNVAKAEGRLTAALDAYDRVLAREPEHVDALVNKGAVLAELGRPLDARATYEQALKVSPKHADARYNLGVLFQETGDPEAALEIYNQLIAETPDQGGAKVNRVYALKEVGRLDDAIAAAETLIQEMPDYDKLFVNLGDLYLESGAPEKALSLADAYLDRHPANTSMLAFKAIALAGSDPTKAMALLDLDRLVRPFPLPTPDGFESVADFNRALAQHVRTHPSLMPSPKSHATRAGRHSGELLTEPKGPVAGLEAAIMSLVDRYRDEVPVDPDHPWTERRPNRLGLSIWGVVMEDGGHQVPHIHPSAWLSGVYYPEVPARVKANDPDHVGWIEFGRSPDDFHGTGPDILRLIKPEEGLIILFPSYLYHRTVPLDGGAERVSVAFDVLPLD